MKNIAIAVLLAFPVARAVAQQPGPDLGQCRQLLHECREANRAHLTEAPTAGERGAVLAQAPTAGERGAVLAQAPLPAPEAQPQASEPQLPADLAPKRAAPACATFNGPYFKAIFSDPAHPKLSAKVLYTSKWALDGGVTDAAVVYHKGDPKNTLLPQQLLDLGIEPISWTLLEIGAGGNTQTGFLHFGMSINAAPSLLGPLVGALNRSGGTYATVGNLLLQTDAVGTPTGSGVNLSLGWKTNVVENGGVVQFDHMRFPPRYGVGYTYQF